jgi:tetratricopeptide (TPR) repeat protein
MQDIGSINPLPGDQYLISSYWKGLKLLFFFLILTYQVSNSQQRPDIDSYKRTALLHMQAGRYGDAIDQLNKYISATPEESDGYNLRALCFEKRQQYQFAVLDYRRAIALETVSASKRMEYEKNLRRVQDVWYAILLKSIEGYKREIAIDPSKPFNYLEIGKCYRWMEIWDKAEEWYDEYLKRDDNASPDEIIRYTEILSHTGSIVKGERILKKYVERYPQDWRLWSRYGYFTLWLSKFAIAKKAFETALGFKPFFKEAQDGLDIVNRQAYVSLENPRSFEKEYPIDRYLRLLKKNPNDFEMRYTLVDSLISAKRFQEAYQQLEFISLSQGDSQRYKDKLQQVLDLRDKVYRAEIDSAKVKLLHDEYDKDALKKVALHYEYLQNYDSAAVMLDKYFEKYPDETDSQLRYRYARICAWNREFDKAIEITDKLLKDDPDNPEYQLFRAQVSVWTNRDPDLAKEYLDNVLKAKPHNVEALVSMGSLLLLKSDFENAQIYADSAKAIEPNNDDVIKLQSNIDWQKMRAEEEKLYAILELGRQRVVAEDCPGALQFYEEYLSKAEPNVLIQKEYGDVLFCAKEYQKALDTYNQVLGQGFNYDAAMQRAKVYYAMNDSINALREFKDLAKKDSTSFDAHLYLADTYAKVGRPDTARVIYDNLQENWKLDSTQTKMVQIRKGWLPVTGLAGLLETFPNYVGVAPIGSYYADNLSFRLSTLGARLELGFTSYISFGVTFLKTWIKADSASLNQDVISQIGYYTGDIRFTTFKWGIFIHPGKNLNLGFEMGSSNALGLINRDEKNAFLRYERKDTIGVNLTYQNSDAVLILYSPYLIDIREYAQLYKIDGYYQHRDGLRISGSFQYISVGDGDEGNDFMIRIGKYFAKGLLMGYEYAYDNYKFKSSYYYTPNNFESHSLWLDEELEKKDDLRLSIGGKLGFIPHNSLIAMEGHVELFYQVRKNLSLSGKVSIGSTSRDDQSYRYFSGQISAFWTVF